MLNSGYFYLAVIYIVWGTTYLAMRVGVGPGSGFPVFAFGAARCLAAAGLLLAIAKVRKQRLGLSLPEAAYLAFTGLGMWTAAHGMVLAAERTIASGFAAVAVSASPIWVLLLAAAMDKTRPHPGQLFFVVLGLLGVASLVVPELRLTAAGSGWSAALLFLSPIVWAYCALFVKRNPQRLSTSAVSGYQHLFGGLGFLGLAFIFREPWPTPTLPAWDALGFLVIFGSVIAFTSYIKALELLPAHVVTTNTYVNPVIAVFLGWLILREAVTA